MKTAGKVTVFMGCDPVNQPKVGLKVICLCGAILETTEDEHMSMAYANVQAGDRGLYTPVGWYAHRGCPACGGSVFVPKGDK